MTWQGIIMDFEHASVMIKASLPCVWTVEDWWFAGKHLIDLGESCISNAIHWIDKPTVYN